MVLVKSRVFWTLVAGLLIYIIKVFYPQFPLDQDGILALVIFVLGLFGITPELKARGLM